MMSWNWQNFQFGLIPYLRRKKTSFEAPLNGVIAHAHGHLINCLIWWVHLNWQEGRPSYIGINHFGPLSRGRWPISVWNVLKRPTLIPVTSEYMAIEPRWEAPGAFDFFRGLGPCLAAQKCLWRGREKKHASQIRPSLQFQTVLSSYKLIAGQKLE